MNKKTTNKIITVDFDGTLAYQLKKLIPNQKIIIFVKEKILHNYIVIILSKRLSKDKIIIENFCKENSILAKDIICTDRKSKIPFIKSINPEFHIDNNLKTCLEIKKHGYNSYYTCYNLKKDLLKNINYKTIV
jgi:hypothetical protein